MCSEIAILSCTKTKQDYECAAIEMYSKSQLFNKLVAYCSQHYDDIYILSAQYGLLKKDTIIKPYDLSLYDMSKQNRIDWSDEVYQSITTTLSVNDYLYFFCGDIYRRYIIPRLITDGYVIDCPLKNMGIGKQLEWLNSRI